MMPKASRPNEVWTYDFVFDRDAAGRRLKLLTLMDEFTREGLAIRVGRSFKAVQVKEVLRQVGEDRGYPEFLRSDNGAEFIAEIVKEFLAENNIRAAYIEPGSPWQNGKGESFNGKFRDECLRMEIFGNWREAGVIAEQWRKFYNSERPHSSLGYQTPDEFKRDWEQGQKLLENVTRQKLAIPMAQGLGLDNTTMPNNPDKIQALENAGLQVVERVPIEVEAQEPAAHYLKTKKEKLGHLLDFGKETGESKNEDK